VPSSALIALLCPVQGDFTVFSFYINITNKAGIIVGPDRQSASDRIASPRRIRSDRAGIKVGPDCGPGRIMQV
jgi:hypothetical protein